MFMVTDIMDIKIEKIFNVEDLGLCITHFLTNTKGVCKQSKTKLYFVLTDRNFRYRKNE